MKSVLSMALLINLSSEYTGQSHVHISVQEKESGLQLFIEDFSSGDFDPEIYPFRLPPTAMTAFSQDQADNGIGRLGAAAWVLPQSENPELLFLGWSSRLPMGRYEGNRTFFKLKSLSGPGDCYVYQVGPFGDMDVWINSSDDVGDTDVVKVRNAGGHEHCNWVFTRPGIYFVELQAEAQLSATGAWVTSASRKLRFQVIMPETKLHWIPDDGGIRFQWLVRPGLTYQMESIYSLKTSEWKSIGLPVSKHSTEIYDTESIGFIQISPNQFFRLKINFLSHE